MKKILVLAVAVVSFAFPPLMVVAQSQTINLFSGSIGGPNTRITVINNTADNSPLIATIGNRKSHLVQQGQTFGIAFGPFSNVGQILILVQACRDTEPAYRFNSAPEWPDNIPQPAGLAITDQYLRTSPDKNDLKRHVDDIKKFMKRQPGGNEYISEMKNWLSVVDADGIAMRVEHCSLPYTMPAVTWNYAAWNSYGGNVETVLTIVGDRQHGYSIQNPPRWVQ